MPHLKKTKGKDFKETMCFPTLLCVFIPAGSCADQDLNLHCTLAARLKLPQKGFKLYFFFVKDILIVT